MDSLSDKTKENFLKYIHGWDLSIESLDDKEEQEKIKNILLDAVNFLNMQLVEWEEKTPKEKILELFENPKYKRFKRTSDNLYYVKTLIERIYENKNRRTRENIELRSKLAEIKLKGATNATP